MATVRWRVTFCSGTPGPPLLAHLTTLEVWRPQERSMCMATLVRWCAYCACALLGLGFCGSLIWSGDFCRGLGCIRDPRGPVLGSFSLLVPGLLLSLLT